MASQAEADAQIGAAGAGCVKRNLQADTASARGSKVRTILGTRVNATSYTEATGSLLAWAHEAHGRYVSVANVHMVMEAYDDAAFRGVVNAADLVTPDGMPLVWMLRLLGERGQGRVYGPTLTLHVCEAAEREGVPIGLYGGTPSSLTAMQGFLSERYPALRVAYAYAPPFRALSAVEDAEVVAAISASGARLLFVGLGCPKQERWMATHKDRLPIVQIGVGAAFDFHSGRVAQAPRWMQDRGLEWLFRLSREPRRLFKRYAVHNPRFVVLAMLQLLCSLSSRAVEYSQRLR